MTTKNNTIKQDNKNKNNTSSNFTLLNNSRISTRPQTASQVYNNEPQSSRNSQECLKMKNLTSQNVLKDITSFTFDRLRLMHDTHMNFHPYIYTTQIPDYIQYLADCTPDSKFLYLYRFFQNYSHTRRKYLLDTKKFLTVDIFMYSLMQALREIENLISRKCNDADRWIDGTHLWFRGLFESHFYHYFVAAQNCDDSNTANSTNTMSTKIPQMIDDPSEVNHLNNHKNTASSNNYDLNVKENINIIGNGNRNSNGNVYHKEAFVLYNFLNPKESVKREYEFEPRDLFVVDKLKTTKYTRIEDKRYLVFEYCKCCKHKTLLKDCTSHEEFHDNYTQVYSTHNSKDMNLSNFETMHMNYNDKQNLYSRMIKSNLGKHNNTHSHSHLQAQAQVDLNINASNTHKESICSNGKEHTNKNNCVRSKSSSFVRPKDCEKSEVKEKEKEGGTLSSITATANNNNLATINSSTVFNDVKRDSVSKSNKSSKINIITGKTRNEKVYDATSSKVDINVSHVNNPLYFHPMHRQGLSAHRSASVAEVTRRLSTVKQWRSSQLYRDSGVSTRASQKQYNEGNTSKSLGEHLHKEASRVGSKHKLGRSTIDPAYFSKTLYPKLLAKSTTQREYFKSDYPKQLFMEVERLNKPDWISSEQFNQETALNHNSLNNEDKIYKLIN